MFDVTHISPTGFLIAIAFLIVVIIVGRFMAKNDTIRIPRVKLSRDINDNAEEWKLGSSIAANTCPTCFEQNFYSGPSASDSTVVFCGNSNCRAGFRVWHYGNGLVWAERIDEKGPDSLYDNRKPRRSNKTSRR